MKGSQSIENAAEQPALLINGFQVSPWCNLKVLEGNSTFR
jgi:hypothetical protein